MSAEPVGRWVCLALFSRLLHLAESVHYLVEAGFGDAAEPLARAMTSASISIVTIVDGDSDNRPRLPYRDRDAYEISASASDTAVLTEYANNGVTPVKLGPRDTWHGLTDHDLFDQMKAAWWYDLFYAPFSDEAHANAATLGPEILALRAGKGVVPGPRDGDPTITLLGSVQTVCQALSQLDTQRGWSRKEDIDKAFQEARSELEAAAGLYQ